MPNLNKVLLMGNLTRDPEIKYTPKGTAICAFGLAINRNYTTEAGEKREEVTFIDCEAFARVAEVIGEYCKKGGPIFIEGRLKLESWEDKATGQKRQKLKVIAENMQLLSRREKEPDAETVTQADAAAAGRRAAPSSAPRTRDPDLDQPDDIPF